MWNSDAYRLELQFSIRETVCTKASGRDPFTCDFKIGPFVVSASGVNVNPRPLCRMFLGHVETLLVLKNDWLSDKQKQTQRNTTCSMEWVLGGKGQCWETLLPGQWGIQELL